MKKRHIIMSAFFLGLTILGYGQGVKVTPGTNVILETGTTLNVEGGGDFVLEDDYTYSPSLLERGNVAFTGGGDLKVQQYLEKGEWHIISSPLSNEDIGAYLDIYLYSYDEPTDAFTNLYTPLTTPLNVGEGYHVWSVAASADFVTLNGTSNKTDVSRVLTLTPATNSSGWNLLGNPYPCAIDWNGHADWNLNNVDPTVYLFDAGGSGNYTTWNYVTNTGTNGKTDGYIAATQGFWVRTSDTLASQPSYSLTIPASQRVASPATEFYKNEETPENMLRLHVQGENYSDECIIAFNGEATDLFDNGFDAYKLFTPTPSPKLYSISGDIKQAVNIMQGIEGNETVPVYFHVGMDGSFTLHINGLESFPGDLPIFLEDKQDNVFQDLRENADYTFTGTILDDRDRFVVHFSNPLGIDNLENNQMEAIHIYSWEKSVFVDIPFKFSGTIEVYDLLGKIIATENAVEGQNEIEMFNSQGYYVVRVIGENGLKTQKLNIR
jgi:hypothetical protein